ncbi:MAG: hypothetical protein KDB88_14055 [Flavobacteriales bacterium]|nr:hypothetical protein [Flavobacteriales bacterium]
MRSWALLLAMTACAYMAQAQSEMDPSYFQEQEVGPYKLRSIGGVLGVSIDDHGPLGLDDMRKFSRDGFPTVPDDLSKFYFGFNSTSIGLVLGPRVTIARTVDEQPRDRGWNFHLGLMPRLFYLFYYLDEAQGDTLVSTSYLYTLTQMEIAVGAGHFWRAAVTRSFYLQGTLMLEIGNAATSTLNLVGLRELEYAGSTTEQTILDRSYRARGSTYGRVFATAEVGFRIRQKVDLGAHVQFGTGLMYLHGLEVRPVLSSMVYALQMQFLIRR